MFEQVARRLAALIAHWQAVGFIHGVMNTDNMLLSGETIDFGPCAFMDGYDSAAVFSSIDHGSRYAYRNQPAIAQWNLACLGQSLLPLLLDNDETDDETAATEAAQTVLNAFPEYYMEAYFGRLRAKFGLCESQHEDEALMQEFLDLLETDRHDFTLAFRRLADLAAATDEVGDLFDFPQSFNPWIQGWQQRCAQESISAAQRQQQMRATNPAFIARNHLVEKAIAEAYGGDFSFFHRLHERLQQPFIYAAGDTLLATPPKPDEIVQQTFCGT
jgi:uncharacterized protein YdiU (UPF0061 family)